MHRLGNVLFVSLLMVLGSSLGVIQAGSVYAQEEPLTVEPFKGTYSVGMTAIIFGQVSGSFTAGSSVSIKVTNPDGQTYHNANAELDEAGAYTFEFELEGTEATVLGIHTVEATFQGQQASTSFEVKERAALELSVEKNKFNLGDMVVISGTVTPRLVDPVEIKIYNPDDKVWKFFAVSPDQIRQDGTFMAEVGELSGKLSKPGKYKVEASYADNTASAMLEFDVGITGKVTPGRFMLVNQLGDLIEEIFVGDQVLVQADIRNNLAEKQPFSFFVLITDADGFTISISWITGTLPEEETLAAAQSWVPDNAGTFIVKIFVWKSVTEPEVLGKSLETTVTVSE